jgi:hypothetical protein
MNNKSFGGGHHNFRPAPKQEAEEGKHNAHIYAYIVHQWRRSYEAEQTGAIYGE